MSSLHIFKKDILKKLRQRQQTVRRVEPVRVMVLGFAAVILIGALLLMLPISTRSGEGADFITALFTATSATCVTGLVVEDTYLFWSPFGCTVIILLIQTGGLGFMTIATLLFMVAGKRITDLGSGLNLYAVEPLKTEYYKKFPDTLYFNDCMILALCQLKQRVLFFPISWREEDQVSNNKLTSFGISLLKLCGRYLAGKQKFVTREWREKPIENYTSSVIASNL